MRESWRWFGPDDPITLGDIRQTGATDVVSALYSIPIGEVWPLEEIRNYQFLIETTQPEQSPLKWSVVESIPVHEDIKLAKPGHDIYVSNWIQSMVNLAACGIKTICYNFMPVIDWTRTDLKYKLPSGGYTLRFDQKRFAAFDLFILRRENADADYSSVELYEAKQVYDSMSSNEKDLLTRNIIAGLPGKMTESYTLDDFRKKLSEYKNINSTTLRENLFAFLEKVIPHAEESGVRLAIHPDDPPWDLLGLPGIICSAQDVEKLFNVQPSSSNGITLCVGTYGSRSDNDIPAMARQFGNRIYFAHLRGVNRDPDNDRSFLEANHLDSDIDMVSVIRELLTEESRRRKNDKEINEIYIRPDHGHQIMDDINKTINPGYSGIGRLKGLAEVRGVIRALSA